MDMYKMDPFKYARQCIGKRCGLHLKEYQVQCTTCDQEKLGIYNSKGGFTACSSTHHMTREQALEIIPKIVEEFVKAKCVQTIQYFNPKPDIETLRKTYETVQKDTVDINKISAQKAGKSNELIRGYMPHLVEVEDHKGHSICKSWTTENLTEILIKSINTGKSTVQSYPSEILKKLKYSPVTIYSPLMTKRILEELNCRTVFDPCIGWGGRMLGTAMKGGSYTGCEPFTRTFQGLTEIKKDFKLQNIEIHNKPVEDVLESLGEKTYEMCLTSPPYYDLEVYSHEATQSTEKYKTYDIWIQDFLKPIIEYVCSHVTKYSCWSVKNFKTGETYNLLDDVIRLHEENGWVKAPMEYSITKNTKGNNQATGDVTYVFVKNGNAIDVSAGGELQKPLVLKNPEFVQKIGIEYQKAQRLLNDGYGSLPQELREVLEKYTDHIPDLRFASQSIVTQAQSSQCNEIYEENLSEILGITNLTEKHGYDGLDEILNEYYEYKPTKPKSGGRGETATVSINDDSHKKITESEKHRSAWFVIAVIDRDDCHYKMIYKFPMRILTEDRKKYLAAQIKKNSRRVVYQTHIQSCIRWCLDQRETYYRWVPPE